MNLSVIIPVYNSELLLPNLVRGLRAVLHALADDYQLILINDGSRDRSWDVICDLAAQYDWVLGINLMRNYGQHNALLCGIRAAKYEIIVTMDDDLQHPRKKFPNSSISWPKAMTWFMVFHKRNNTVFGVILPRI